MGVDLLCLLHLVTGLAVDRHDPVAGLEHPVRARSRLDLADDRLIGVFDGTV